jgi:carboxyl-terminal processing protease
MLSPHLFGRFAFYSSLLGVLTAAAVNPAPQSDRGETGRASHAPKKSSSRKKRSPAQKKSAPPALLPTVRKSFRGEHEFDPDSELSERQPYSIDVANRVLYRGIVAPQMEHYIYGFTKGDDRNYQVGHWARNWMSKLDGPHVVFLESDYDRISETISNMLSSEQGPSQIYSNTLVPVRALYIQRLKTYLQLAHEILRKKELDLSDHETLRMGDVQAAFPLSERSQRRRIRQALEAKFLGLQLDGRTNVEAYQDLEALLQRLDNVVVDPNDNRNQSVSDFLNAYLQTLDPHCGFTPPSRVRDFRDRFVQHYFGIGAFLYRNEAQQIAAEIPLDSPAQKAGMENGDILLGYYIDGKEYKSFEKMPLTEISKLMHGDQESRIKIRVRRSLDSISGTSKLSEKDVEITRDQISQDTIRARAMIYSFADQKVIVFSAGDFYDGLSEDIEAIAQEVKSTIPGITGVILDFSGNGGGILEEAVRTTGLFIKKGPVTQGVYLRRAGNGLVRYPRRFRDLDSKQLFDLPILVKIDGETASASEIVAAALQDHGRALVVGEWDSLGKGTIQENQAAYREPRPELSLFLQSTPVTAQEIFKNGILKFTVGAFYRVTGTTTQFNGVQSDLALYEKGVSVAFEKEQDMPFALKLGPYDSADPLFDPAANRYFSEALRTDLQSFNQENVAKNQKLKWITSYLKIRRAEDKKPINLNWNARVEARATELSRNQNLVENLRKSRLIPDLRTEQVAFTQGKISHKVIRNIEDTDDGPSFRHTKDEMARLEIQRDYEKNFAEMEALLPIFSEIKRFQAAQVPALAAQASAALSQSASSR